MNGKPNVLLPSKGVSILAVNNVNPANRIVAKPKTFKIFFKSAVYFPSKIYFNC